MKKRMESLVLEIDALIDAEIIQGTRDGKDVLIRLDRADRTQKIRISQSNDAYEFTSVVARVKDVAGRGNESRNALLFRILCRNALKPIVFLYIDGRDRVVGKVTCPIDSTHSGEIEFYLTTLSRDCDRFEYVLSGLDHN